MKDYGYYPDPDTFEVEIDDDKLWSFICDNRAKVIKAFDHDILKYLNASSLCEDNEELSEKIDRIDSHLKEQLSYRPSVLSSAIIFILSEMKEAYEGQL